MKERLSDVAFQLIRELIVSGELESGSPLSELQLGARLGMSRSPIRTALEQLTSANLVRSVPGRGYFVSSLSVSRMTNVMEVREALEGFAALRGDFADRLGTLGKLRELFLYYIDLERDPTTREWGILSAADRRFHAEIILSLDNPVASQTLDQLSLSLDQVRALAWSRAGRFRTGAGEHVSIIDALVTGDQSLAAELVGNHLARAREFLLLGMTSSAPGTLRSFAPERELLESWLSPDGGQGATLQDLIASLEGSSPVG